MVTTATLSRRFQISIPKSVREQQRWQAGQELILIPNGKGVLLIPMPELQQLAGIAKGARKDGYRDREAQAGFDVSKGLAPGELGEDHHAKQVGAAQHAHTRIALVALDDPTEGLPRHELHHLREQRLAHVHASPQVVQTCEHRKQPNPNSNRGHP